MSKIQHPDIGDNQIRIISAESLNNNRKPSTHKSRRNRIIALIISVIAIIAIVAFILWHTSPVKDEDDELAMNIVETSPVPVNTQNIDTIATPTTQARVEIRDTIVDGHKLTVIKPIDGKPELAVGADALNDTTAILVVQAADVRRDNGKIVGAFVSKGQLISSGKSKAGFCAIIGGKITLGVADATPYLEQAIDTEGYFFRQYPLVVGGQIVENKPKGKSYRKALAELNGTIVVILSRDRLTFHDFSQTLIDIGVTNAIYLTGSTAYCFAKTDNGDMVTFGTKNHFPPENVSFLLWR